MKRSRYKTKRRPQRRTRKKVTKRLTPEDLVRIANGKRSKADELLQEANEIIGRVNQMQASSAAHKKKRAGSNMATFIKLALIAYAVWFFYDAISG